MKSQKEAVFSIITTMFEIEGNGAVQLDKSQKHDVIDALVVGFVNKEIQYAGNLPEGKDLRNYCSGLLNNWLRKDTRLNGGTAYVAKNPGSRTGSTDPQIKAMKALLATRTDAAERAEIQSFIDARIAQIKPAKSVTVNADDLPAELRAKLKI